MTKILKQTPSGRISFFDLLLDETLCAGEIAVEKNLIIQAGGINSYLRSKQKYELLLRIAATGNIDFFETTELDSSYIILEDDSTFTTETGWQTDCYIAGKYSQLLHENNLFDLVIESILNDAKLENRQEDTLYFLEHMIAHDDIYWHIAEGSCPILIYKGDDICHNVLNIFAEQFGMALEHTGKKIVYFDCGKEDLNTLTSYINQHFQAIIGIQSYLFSIKMKDELHYLHEYIYGPKYNI